MSWIKRMSAIARVKVDMPPEWHGWLFEAVDGGGILITGAVCPLKTRGPNKGDPAFNRKDPNTVRRVYVSPAELIVSDEGAQP